MSRFLKIGEAAKYLGVSIQTLRRWEAMGRLKPVFHEKGQTRYYQESQILNCNKSEESKDLTIAYARVSSHDQREDLTRQEQLLEQYCIAKGWRYEIISDLGSGMNYRKKGLRQLIDLILNCKMYRLVLTHKDRLLRFGAELIFTLCEIKEIEVVLINQGADICFEEELTKDVLEIITVFSARLYGSRSHRNKKLLNAVNALAGSKA